MTKGFEGERVAVGVGDETDVDMYEGRGGERNRDKDLQYHQRV